MTVGEAIKKATEMRPNQYDDATLAGWLSELDGTIYRDLMCSHEDAPDDPGTYDAEEDTDTDLLVTAPDDGLYVMYLCTKIDWWNAEYERYNNELLAFNMAYDRYSNAYNKAHLPLQPNSLSFWGTYEEVAGDNPLNL